jgi:hypothetical protein
MEEQVKLEFRWVALSELSAINLRPTFLQTSLAGSSLLFSHEVQREYE